MVCKGKAIPRNQTAILKMLLDNEEILLDFTCDYSDDGINVKLPQVRSRVKLGMKK